MKGEIILSGRYIDLKSYAHHEGISIRGAQWRARWGKVPVIRIGREYLVKVDELQNGKAA